MRSTAGPVVIVGMCRSGTSSVAGALAALGVYFGRAELLYAADSHNETGYWEHKLVNAANRKFHMSLNLRSLDSDPLPEDWLQRPMSDTFTTGLADVMKTHLSSHPLWGWKDPQASTTLPYVREAFRRLDQEPVVVICVRNPLDVAESQAKRQGSPKLQTVGAWMLSTLAALRDSCGLCRRVVLYESLLEDPQSMLEPIADVLNIQVAQMDWSFIKSLIRPSLSHGAGTQPDFGALPSLVQEIYELCKDISKSPSDLDAGLFDKSINELWKAWKTWHDMLERSEIGEVSFRLSWASGGEPQVRETKYRPSKHWQTLKCKCDARQAAKVALHLFPLPAIIWVRKAVWCVDTREIPTRLQPGQNGQLDEFQGIQRIWAFHGAEQAWCVAPKATDSAILEIEVLIESGNLITGLTVQDLSRRLSS